MSGTKQLLLRLSPLLVPLGALGVMNALLIGCSGDSTSAPSTENGKSASPRTDTSPVVRFVDRGEALGLNFVHRSGIEPGQHHMPSVLGSGAALFDLERDGDLDLYLIQGKRTETERDRLFVLEGPRYRDGSRLAGLFAIPFGTDDIGMGVAVGDVDGDGDSDLYLTQLGTNRLLLNGGGRLVDATSGSGADIQGWSTSAAFCDLDADGDLDLYVARYVTFDPDKTCTNHTGAPDFCGPKEFPAQPDVYLEGDGEGHFSDRSEQLGLSALPAAGLGVVCADFNDDGRPDVYVANDAYSNHLHVRNPVDGAWTEEALSLGIGYNQLGQAEASMGVVAADFDGDGALDLFMTHLSEESNTLYRARKGLARGNSGSTFSGYRDASGSSGLGPSSMRYTGFGTVAIDIELDGDLDICIANGRVFRGEAWPGAPDSVWRDFLEPNLTFLGDGAGHFASVKSGEFETHLELSRGLVCADVDSDGDLDLVLTNTDGNARIFENRSERQGLHVFVALDGAGRAVQGSQVTIEAGGRRFVASVGGGGGYLCARPLDLHFGLGQLPTGMIDGALVRWPDGSRERFPGMKASQRVVLERGTGTQESD